MTLPKENVATHATGSLVPHRFLSSVSTTAARPDVTEDRSAAMSVDTPKESSNGNARSMEEACRSEPRLPAPHLA